MAYHFTCEICKCSFTDKKRKNRKVCSFKCNGQHHKNNYSSENCKLYGRKLKEEHKMKIRENNGMRGKHLSEEAKEKLRIANLGEKNPHYGKPNSPECRLKISLSHKGKDWRIGNRFSKETRRKIVETRMKNGSYNPSEETRKKISLANRGRIITQEHIRKILETKRKNNTLSHSEETKRRIRESVKTYMKKCQIVHPRCGKYEHEILDKLQEIIGFSIKRQFFINGYYLDGYCQEINLAIEVYENHHYKKDMIDKDKIRKEEIIKALNCNFLEIKELEYIKNKNLEINPELLKNG